MLQRWADAVLVQMSKSSCLRTLPSMSINSKLENDLPDLSRMDLIEGGQIYSYLVEMNRQARPSSSSFLFWISALRLRYWSMRLTALNRVQGSNRNLWCSSTSQQTKFSRSLGVISFWQTKYEASIRQDESSELVRWCCTSQKYSLTFSGTLGIYDSVAERFRTVDTKGVGYLETALILGLGQIDLERVFLAIKEMFQEMFSFMAWVQLVSSLPKSLSTPRCMVFLRRTGLWMSQSLASDLEGTNLDLGFMSNEQIITLKANQQYKGANNRQVGLLKCHRLTRGTTGIALGVPGKYIVQFPCLMNPGNRIGIPSIIPFARRKSETTITPQAKNRDSLSKEMLEARIIYMQTGLNAFDQFESTRNVNAILGYVMHNNITLKQMIDRIYLMKQCADADPSQTSLIQARECQRLGSWNEELRKESETEKRKNDRIKQQFQQHTSGAKGEQQIQVLQQALMKLKRQEEQLTGRISGMAPTLVRKPFFKEFEYMHLECEGLNRQNDKLRENIRRRKEELQALKLEGK